MGSLTKNITPLNPFGFSKKNILAPIGNEYSPATGFKKALDPITTPNAATPSPAPPISASNAEVMQAQQDLIQQQMMKKSVKKTSVAGDTGGYRSAAATGIFGQPLGPSGVGKGV